MAATMVSLPQSQRHFHRIRPLLSDSTRSIAVKRPNLRPVRSDSGRSACGGIGSPPMHIILSLCVQQSRIFQPFLRIFLIFQRDLHGGEAKGADAARRVPDDVRHDADTLENLVQKCRLAAGPDQFSDISSSLSSYPLMASSFSQMAFFSPALRRMSTASMPVARSFAFQSFLLSHTLARSSGTVAS